MVEHDMKIWPEWFQEVKSGLKKAELRMNDRGFFVGDWLLLREWNPRTKVYTGEYLRRRITHILREHPGLQEGYVVLSLRIAEDTQEKKPAP